MNILVAYASCTGTTQKIAEHISARLTSTPTTPPISTTLHSISIPNPSNPFKSTPSSYRDIDISPFDAIVIGSAIHGQKWLPEAETLVSKLGNAAKAGEPEKPVFAFSVGVPNAMPLGIGGMLGRSEERRLDAQLRGTLLGWLKGHRLFYGVWTREMLGKGALGKVWGGLWGSLGGKFGEFTDLGEVEKWVDDVVLVEVKKRAGERE